MNKGRLTRKQQQRLENKKRKIAAYLDIAEQNERDRLESKKKQIQEEEIVSLIVALKNCEKMMVGDGPDRKKLRIEVRDWETANKQSYSGFITENIPNLPEKKELLVGEEYEELKRKLRERKKALKVIPRLIIKEPGEKALIKNEDKLPLFMKDIQDLIVYTQTQNTFYLPRWCLLEKANRVEKTIVLLVEGVDPKDVMSTLNQSKFDVGVEFVSPYAYGTDLLSEINNVPLCLSKQRMLINQYGSMENAAKYAPVDIKYKSLEAMFPIVCDDEKDPFAKLPDGDKFPRTSLLLSAWQMIEENYPVPLEGSLKKKFKHFIMTKDKYKEVTVNSQLFSVDCEMCRTCTGELELTRISVVNQDLQVIYDTLVKPYNKIVNYLTQYSGVTQEMLENVTVRLEDVQDKLKELLPPDGILVGHSLNCDMIALQIMHPYVMDTSVIFNISGNRSRKPKLMTLSKEFLNERIQDGYGHCSTEDSLACMKLVKLKLANNLKFGDAVLNGGHENTNNTDDDDCNKRLTTCLLSQVRCDKKGILIANEATIDRYIKPNITQPNISIVKEENCKEIIKRCCDSVVSDYKFILGHVSFNEISDKTIKKFNKWCNRLLNTTPPLSTLVILLASYDKNIKSATAFVYVSRPEI